MSREYTCDRCLGVLDEDRYLNSAHSSDDCIIELRKRIESLESNLEKATTAIELITSTLANQAAAINMNTIMGL